MITTEDARHFSVVRVRGFPCARIIGQLIPPARLPDLEEHYVRVLFEGAFSYDSSWGKNRLYLRCDPIGMRLLRDCRQRVEQVLGAHLDLGYSFVSYYRRGSNLARHVDKPQCEFTVGTILFRCARAANSPSPYLFLGSQDAPTQIYLWPGDGLVFEGSRTPHWRNELEEEFMCTLLLHFKRKSSIR